jgi:Photosynthetic reaction centre cytochrome C subunit
MNKKIFIYAGIVLFIISGIAATHLPPEKPEWKNLKILPKNTGTELMEQIMHQYTAHLGVTCTYCHPDTKPDVFPRRVDFASDEKPEKLIARNMMRMTARINSKYFGYRNKYDFDTFRNAVITCKTCHRGLPKPSHLRLFH